MKKLRRRLKGRFGLASPHLAVRRHLPWPARWLLLALVFLLAVLFARQVFDYGMHVAGYGRATNGDELMELRATTRRLEAENAELRRARVAAESQLQIERAAGADLMRSLKAQQEANARLQEDVAFFQTLMPGSTEQERIGVYRLALERGVTPGEYRYRLLVVQEGRRERDFKGRMQLSVSYVAGGRKESAQVPLDGVASNLAFRYYQRLEGGFRLPPDAVVKSLQARVFEPGVAQPRGQQTINLP